MYNIGDSGVKRLNIEYIRSKITELRVKRGITEYQMSKELGHGKNYIRNIVIGHSRPSITELFYIIDYLGVTPRDFFDEQQEYKNPILARSIMDGIKDLSDKDLQLVLQMIERLNENEERE